MIKTIKKTKNLALVFLTCLVCGVAQAAVIKEIIIVDKDSNSYPKGQINALMASKINSEFNLATFHDDLKRIIKLESILNASGTPEATNDGKVIITIKITPAPYISSVNITGCDGIKEKSIIKKLTTKVGELYRVSTIGKDKLTIIETYEKKGFQNISCKVDEKTLDNGNIAITYQINEGNRRKIKKITFKGNTIFSDKKLRKKMLSKPNFFSKVFKVGFHVEDKLDLDKHTIKKRYNDLGYLDFEIVRIEPKVSKNGKWVSFTFFIDEGKQYTISEVKFSGNKLFAAEILASTLKVKAGDKYNSEKIKLGIKLIEREYDVLGYIDFRCHDRYEKDSQTQKAILHLQLLEGMACTINDIMISGNYRTNENVIRRELLIHPGDIANARKIKSTKSILQNMNYFEVVNIVPLATTDPTKRDLEIQVKEKRTGQLNFGGGFSSDDSITGFFSIQQNNFDWKNWPNFTGAGQRMKLSAMLGSKRNDLSLSFIEPWFLDKRLSLSLNLYHHERYEDSYDKQNTGFEPTITWRWKRFWRQSIGLRIAKIKLSDFDSNASAELLAEEDSYNSNAIIFGITRDSRNHFRYPTSGSKISLNLDLTTEALGSYSDIAKINLIGTKYFPIFKKDILKIKAHLGVSEKLSGDDPAIFDRFFAGGQSTIRGFDRREISPVDTTGKEDYLGGEAMLLTTIELTRPLNNMLRFSIFCDAGNVWQDSEDISFSDFNVSVGVGLEIKLPIGPVRLDYGWPVKTSYDHLEDNSGRFHFNMGYTF